MLLRVLQFSNWSKQQDLRRLACKFDLDQNERKSTQVHANPGQTQVDASCTLCLLASPIRQALISCKPAYILIVNLLNK